jgi:hypothetical protein
MSFCHHLVSVVCHLFTFHILIFWPSDFRGEDFKKSDIQKQESPVVAMFVNGSGQNVQSLERTFYRCFISKKSSPLKLLSHMNRNLVGSIYMYGRFCNKFPQSRMKGERHRLSPLLFTFHR